MSYGYETVRPTDKYVSV